MRRTSHRGHRRTIRNRTGSARLREPGQGLIEYALVVALIAIVVVAALTVVGHRTASALCRAGSALGGAGCYSVVRGGGTGADRGMAITTAADGTSYLYGNFTASATFGNTTLTSNGGLDLFVARVSPAGDWEWVVGLGGSGVDTIASGMALDAGGNLVFGGSYAGGIAFGGSALSFSGAGAFVAKLSPSGSWVWADPLTATSVTSAGAGVDAAGNVYTAGFHSGPLAFGGSGLTLAAPAAGADAFVAELSGGGVWTGALKGGAGAATESITSIAVDRAGNSSITGHFSGTASFGATSVTAIGGTDALVAVTNGVSSWRWGASGGGTATDNSWAVAVDQAGNSYISGNLTGTGATFTGASGPVKDVPANAGAYVAKISPTGAWLWVTAPQGTGAAGAGLNGLGVDGSGRVAVAGGVTGPSNVFGSTDVGGPPAGYDIVVAQLSPDGAWLWAKRVGGSAYDLARAAAVDGSGAVYVAGDVHSDSGPISFGPTTITSAGDRDAILARWSSDGSQTAG